MTFDTNFIETNFALLHSWLQLDKYQTFRYDIGKGLVIKYLLSYPTAHT